MPALKATAPSWWSLSIMGMRSTTKIVRENQGAWQVLMLGWYHLTSRRVHSMGSNIRYRTRRPKIK